MELHKFIIISTSDQFLDNLAQREPSRGMQELGARPDVGKGLQVTTAPSSVHRSRDAERWIIVLSQS